ncbi:uncharacterized protein B0I36DRAFT_427794 [Microdochium trichocladiopsis]|uniref:Uncharacterized protein n=1 Tax=Microdochium trichocladiopsis TaxID=1682393 RepID=A0A9P8YFM9_9PEZI|nr:uncharacterized protein B0I36DRAFT_427794 [Microdochium trichocladiopsis]KAH7037043.1 hypothetical protein B0I36DRAFT_427794 [Microdochium trichocladiopsis]
MAPFQKYQTPTASKALGRAPSNKAFQQLVINAVLVNLIDPVRGKPTKDSLEGSLDEGIIPLYQLKQKFLDSFALICATSGSGKETASAVCLEQTQGSSSILRVARNRGLPDNDLKRLKEVLHFLVAVAEKRKTSTQAEGELLKIIVKLDEHRILSLVQKISKLAKPGLRQCLRLAVSNTSNGAHKQGILDDADFRQWLQTCPFGDTALNLSGSSQLATVVQWASEARWKYSQQLQALLDCNATSSPPWVETLHKVARYTAAIKSMIKFAVKQPAVFADIHIMALEAPPPEIFPPPHGGTLLRDALTRLLRGEPHDTMEKLARVLVTVDVEAAMRKACTLTLTLHAEMQLLGFYDQNEHLIPNLRLMGTSKKACFLCHEFLIKHPLQLRVGACHQKVYPTWRPPFSGDFHRGPRSQMWWAFSRKIESEAVKALKTELGGSRRPINRDSTAGPTLTATATALTPALALGR